MYIVHGDLNAGSRITLPFWITILLSLPHCIIGNKCGVCQADSLKCQQHVPPYTISVCISNAYATGELMISGALSVHARVTGCEFVGRGD